MTREDKIRLLEALIFASTEAVTLNTLKAQFPETEDIESLVSEIREFYKNRGIVLVEIDGCFSFRTALDLADSLNITRYQKKKLPKAAAEVLAIIAYHQPVTRAEIETIRGVETSKGSFDILLELSWIRPGKRRDTPGRPMTWITTPEFLNYFNIESIRDLPEIEELRSAGLLDAKPILENMPKEKEDEA
ncbi:MAG: SMC-Scp complex subunit ScpB [Alphaproteobacteria bacterium]|nr:SMC-Scp complex subunit ScpB [Alphaproteobacteria bacterium]MCL2505954.1 SMC-Scp complex subunit ScpB [Alphaproteobacteria bacterium]